MRAQDSDRKALSDELHKLSVNDQCIMDAIQDQNGVHRRIEELLVGVLKVRSGHSDFSTIKSYRTYIP